MNSNSGVTAAVFLKSPPLNINHSSIHIYILTIFTETFVYNVYNVYYSENKKIFFSGKLVIYVISTYLMKLCRIYILKHTILEKIYYKYLQYLIYSMIW